MHLPTRSATDVPSTPDELLHQLQDSGTKFIFVQPAILPVLQKALELGKESGYTLERPEDRIVLLCTPAEKPADSPYKCNEELWSKAARLTRLIDGGEKETAYLCYSSGTTGRAKGVETSHHNITSQIQALSKAYQKLGHQDRILGILPFGHIYGLTLLVHQPLTTCTPVIILPRYDEVQVLKAIQDVSLRSCWGNNWHRADEAVSNLLGVGRPTSPHRTPSFPSL